MEAALWASAEAGSGEGWICWEFRRGAGDREGMGELVIGEEECGGALEGSSPGGFKLGMVADIRLLVFATRPMDIQCVPR